MMDTDIQERLLDLRASLAITQCELDRAQVEIAHARADARALRGSSKLFAAALVVSILGHILRGAL